MTADPAAPSVSSVAEEIRRLLGSIEWVPAGGLATWLPGLAVPAPWTVVPPPAGAAPVTRMALRHVTSGDTDWDGCDVIALYR